ncbi:Pterin-4-alpha-carbinolamine dehydratase [hydrothermal vent metagenome]|uniref:4a-hydroxytetrahydrobiopterin dehydratase n=1 Tax=hydrothermal vent metagenome TaxID=652676 RepID=A0A3B0YVP9_9ZZZZ
MTTKLNDSEITAGLNSLNNQLKQPWTIDNKKLHKTFDCGNFINAFSFMTRVAIYAEKANHHPEWSNVYKTVVIHLVTHEVEGISAKDFELAKHIETTSI